MVRGTRGTFSHTRGREGGRGAPAFDRITAGVAGRTPRTADVTPTDKPPRCHPGPSVTALRQVINHLVGVGGQLGCCGRWGVEGNLGGFARVVGRAGWGFCGTGLRGKKKVT